MPKAMAIRNRRTESRSKWVAFRFVFTSTTIWSEDER